MARFLACLLLILVNLCVATAEEPQPARNQVTNNAAWHEGNPTSLPDLQRPKVETVWLYQPSTEWTYSHHAHITRFKDQFVAIWSNGRIGEDEPGQRVLVSTSRDFLHWTAPQPLVDSVRDADGVERVLTGGGFHVGPSMLVAYVGNYGPNKETPHLEAATSPDGEHWSEVRDLGLPVCPNHGPQATASGRLILSCAVAFPYTDDPNGLTGWKMSGVYPPEMPNVTDDPVSFWNVAKLSHWPVALCEGSFFQTDDHALHMFFRATGAGDHRLLWLAESHDDGVTWSKPEETQFSNWDAKFHVGRLPDGRFYWIGNPLMGNRTPLVLSLSRDGIHFNQHFVLGENTYKMQREGHWKGGQYGYPHSLVYDNYLYVIYSREKEAVEVTRVSLSELSDDRS